MFHIQKGVSTKMNLETLFEIAACMCLLITTTLSVILMITMIADKITDIQCNIKIGKAADRVKIKEIENGKNNN